MTNKTLLVICRRLWAVRDQINEAYTQFNRARWQALLKREARLTSLILEFRTETPTP